MTLTGISNSLWTPTTDTTCYSFKRNETVETNGSFRTLGKLMSSQEKLFAMKIINIKDIKPPQR